MKTNLTVFIIFWGQLLERGGGGGGGGMFALSPYSPESNNGFYTFFKSQFVVDLDLFDMYKRINYIMHDLKLCTDHCKLLENCVTYLNESQHT